jgi:hypothetical protein
MVLPAGASKGSGLAFALDELGLSPHSTIAFGDAENDLSLLETAEVGVAVSDAVASLKAHADVILERPNGAGIAHFVSEQVLSGRVSTHSERRRIELGLAPNGQPVTMPAARVNLVVRGGSGVGKSHLAGLVAEQLIAMRYSLVVLDFEGDHQGLAYLAGVSVVGGNDPLPPVEHVGERLSNPLGTAVVVDMSLLSDPEKAEYAGALLAYLQRLRVTTGLPHWVLIEEAQIAARPGTALHESWNDAYKGYCFVTYQPEALFPEAIEAADFVVTFDSRERAWLSEGIGRDGLPFAPGHRLTVHVRHVHKYADAKLSEALRFYFRAGDDTTGEVAANLSELAKLTQRTSDATLMHHARANDFSKWVRDVFRDTVLAQALWRLETQVLRSATSDALARFRLELGRTVSERCSPLDEMTGLPKAGNVSADGLLPKRDSARPPQMERTSSTM